MQIYSPHQSRIRLAGIDYVADENGIIDVPDDKINSSVWSSGFVSAKGRLQELAAAQSAALSEAPISAEPAIELTAPPKPVEKTDSKSTKNN